MNERPTHPSGRPIKRQERRGRGFWNVPLMGPVTPRLQTPQAKDAIGFHRIRPQDTEEDSAEHTR